MNIKKVCYMAYQTDWKHKHGVTTQKKVQTIKKYLELLKEEGLDKEQYTFGKYLEEFGYDGELYVCYEEFLNAEYLDKDYMCGLLKTEKCIAMYLEDVSG